MDIEQAIDEVKTELHYATRTYGKFASPHEGYAIIEEELIELREEVFKHHTKRDFEAMLKEAKQVAAMAIRFMSDLC